MGRSHVGSSPEEKGSFETKCDELIGVLIPCSPVPRAERRWVKDFGSEVEPRERGGWREGVFKVWVYFLLSHFNLFGDIVN